MSDENIPKAESFGSALNLNIHFHMLFVDGVYLPAAGGPPVFRPLPAPTGAELQALVQQIAERVGGVLERRGLIERDMENAWLAGDGEAGPLDDLIGPSITYRIAVGPRAGQKLFTLQTVAARAPEWLDDPNGAARAGGFSLHAGIDIAPHQRPKLERLCRYVSRPPVATERMAMDLIRLPALRAQDSVPRRHHAPRAGAAGFHGPARGAGAAAPHAPDQVPRRIRAA